MMAGLGRNDNQSARTRYHAVQWLSSPVFAQQILIAATGALMGLAVLFSMSRAGLFNMLAGITVFGLYLLSKKSLRRYSLVVFIIITIFVGSGAWVGMSKVLDGVRDATSLQAMTWQGRLDLVRSGRAMLGDFPLFGTGLGTMPLAVGRYQSLIEGNWTVFSLHNDWLQAACENGLAGAALIVSMVVIFVVGILARLRHCQDHICKLVSIAALIGAGTMGLHSLADRNLSKVTANGIVFAVLLALAYTAAHLSTPNKDAAPKQPGYWRIRFASRPVRVAVMVIALLGLAILCVEPIKAGIADVKFNRYLAASPLYPNLCQSYPRSRLLARDGYFWLEHSGPTDDQNWAAQQLTHARHFSPDNARYIRAEAMSLVENIDRVIDEHAQLRATMLLGPQARHASELQYKQTLWAMAAMVRAEVYRQDKHKEQLRQACKLLLKAVKLAPSNPGYHLDLAIVLARLDKVYTVGEDNPVEPSVRPMVTAAKEMEIALWLAPRKPEMLFGAGCLALDEAQSADDDQQRQALHDKAVLQFRRAMFGGSAPGFMYPQRVYQLLEMAKLPELMLKATPQTLAAAADLSIHLLKAGRSEQALRVLDIVEKIVDLPANPVSLAYFPTDPNHPDSKADLDWHKQAGTPGDYSPRRRAKGLSKRFVSIAVIGKCDALGRLGRWNQRQEQVTRYRQIARQESQAPLAQAQSQADKRFYPSAMTQYLKLLERDWTNSQALIGAAEIVDMPGMPASQRKINSSIELLYRLIIYNDTLTSGEYERVHKILSRLHPANKVAKVQADFIRAAANCLAGHYGQAVEQLSALVKTQDPNEEHWNQEHLIWYFLGRANEALGQKQDAIASYRKALALVTTHGPTLRALQRLGDENAAIMLAALTPLNKCNIDFQGKVRLLGYTLTKAEDRWQVSYFWQFQDTVMDKGWMDIAFCNARGREVFTDRHEIQHRGLPYRLPTARSGQIVVEQRLLKGNPRDCNGIRLGLWIAQPSVAKPNYAFNRLGHRTTFVRCVTQTENNSGQQAQHGALSHELMPETETVSY